MARLAALPGWTRTSVEDEVADYRNMSPDQRAEALVDACRSAAMLLDSKPELERQKIIDYVDPLPESTLKALRRLRAKLKDTPA